jgi:amino acid adenylation domain-containing protein
MRPYLLWHDLAANAARHPQRPAVSGAGGVLTYRQLDDLSDRVAATLARAGIGRGDRVGLLLPKSERAVAAMLGILKSGAAYVPVDPYAPSRRSAYILADCAVRGLVTTGAKLVELGDARPPSLELAILADDGALVPKAPGGLPVVAWSSLDAASGGAELCEGAVETDPAYLLYTSGSTGHPKGVILSHRHALTFVDWCVGTFGITADDRLSNHAPLHFDLSIHDIFSALRAGACVVVVPDSIHPFPRQLAQWIGREAITVWYSVPSALTRLLLHGSLAEIPLPRLRVVLFAGEVFPVKYLRGVMRLWPHARFFNLYGPTETNVCTYHEVPRDLEEHAAGIPIGRACANTDVFALDDAGRTAAADQEGELCVRGPTVMLGYWGLPDRTRTSLVANPLQPAFHDPLYRTGDLVRRDAAGNYWFVGRRDHMVKSRGYRIELGEIEQALYQHPGIRDAVVVAIPDDEVGARLHAVVVGRPDGESLDGLQAFCLARVPKYMVPESFVIRTELPMTSTGKIDRAGLARELDATLSKGGEA